jgi:DNA-binding NarL/FixJ family response regulator
MPNINDLRILIADDHDIVRRGLNELLSSRRGYVVCVEARTGREAVDMAAEHRPDIVIMDITMPDLNGLEATRQIRKLLPKTEVLVLSLHYTDQLVRDIVEAGARAYVLKADASAEVVTALEALAVRRPFFTSRAGKVLIDGFCNPSAKTLPAHKSLTPREREIVQLLAEGKSSKEVGVFLNLSVKTVETHRSNIMRKLEIHSTSELVRYAVKNNIIEA